MKIPARLAYGASTFVLIAFGYQPSVEAQNAIQALVTGTCGTPVQTLTSGKYGPVYENVSGQVCVNASVSASITGFPTVQSTGVPIAVTTGSATGTLPTGTVVVASNVGAANGAYCKLGASATTSDQLIPPNSWFAFTVGANTQLTCLTSNSTTTVNMVGGSGLPTGAGGGAAGSGGGGAVTVANGADTAEGSTTDAVATTPASGSAATVVSLLKAVNNNVAAAIPAGTNSIGQVGSDPSSGKGTPTSIPINIATATAVQLVALSGSTKIYVTSFDVIAGGTGTITFQTGTGTACANGSTALTGPYPLTAQTGIAKGNGAGAVLITVSGGALCAIASTSTQMSGSLSYQQF